MEASIASSSFLSSHLISSHLISYFRSAHARTRKRERDRGGERERERERDSLVATGNCMHSSPSPLALLLHYICIAPVAPKSRVPSDLTPFSLVPYIHLFTHARTKLPRYPHTSTATNHIPFLKPDHSKSLPMYIISLSLSLFLFGSVRFGLVQFGVLKRRQPHAWHGFLVFD